MGEWLNSFTDNFYLQIFMEVHKDLMILINLTEFVRRGLKIWLTQLLGYLPEYFTLSEGSTHFVQNSFGRPTSA